MLILLAVSTTAGAACKTQDFITFTDCDGETIIDRLPSPPTNWIGEVLTLPGSALKTSIPASGGQPTAQHFELVAQAEDRAKESARQWWINFLNNK